MKCPDAGLYMLLSIVISSLIIDTIIPCLFQTFNIYTGNGSVIPMQPGVTSQTGEQAVTSGSNVTGSTVTSTGATEGGQTVQTGQTGQIAQASINATVTAGVQGGVPGAPAEAAHPGIYHGAFVYNRAIPYFIPPAQYNSHIIARHKEFLDSRGLSRVRK